MSVDQNLPDKFEFTIGAVDDGDVHSVSFKNGQLLLSAGHRYLMKPIAVRQPREADWELFWAELDRIGAWQWNPHYEDPLTLDGSMWDLKIVHQGKKLTIDGMNAYPGSDGPEYPDDSPFAEFIRAVNKLTGEKID